MRRRLRVAVAGAVLVLALVSSIGVAHSRSTMVEAAPVVFGPIAENVQLCLGEETCEVGSVNDDKFADLVAFTRETRGRKHLGDVWVSLSNGTWFGPPNLWLTGFCLGNAECTLGDVNCDGKADLIAFVKDTQGADQLGQVLVAFADNGHFKPAQSAFYSADGQNQRLVFCIGNEVCRIGDVNGDGCADLVAFMRDTNPQLRGRVWFALSQAKPVDEPAAAHFAKPTRLNAMFCTGEQQCEVANVDADKGDELVRFVRETEGSDTTNNVWVYPTNPDAPDALVDTQRWHNAFCFQNERCLVGNVAGDPRADLVSLGASVDQYGKLVYTLKVATALGDHFLADPLVYSGSYCPDNAVCKLGDIDGDGFDELIAFNRTVPRSSCVANVQATFFKPASLFQTSRARSLLVPPFAVARQQPVASAAKRVFVPIAARWVPLFCAP